MECWVGWGVGVSGVEGPPNKPGCVRLQELTHILGEKSSTTATPLELPPGKLTGLTDAW
jgi:hypothetical protein